MVKSSELSDVANENRHNISKIDMIQSYLHDVMNQMQRLNLSADLFFRSPNRKEEYAQEVLDSSKVLTEMLNDTMNIANTDFTKIGSFIIISTRAMFNSFKNDFEAIALSKRIKVVSHYDDTDALTNRENITVDKSLITPALMNIMGNAVKFSERGSEVIFDMKVNIRKVIITIEDSGIGIDPKNIEKVFDKGVYLNNGTANERSSGLGLYYSQLFIRNHGGTIEIDSEKGKGTKVIITLPLKKR